MAIVRVKKKAKSKRSVGERWTEEIASGGWTPVSDIFLETYSGLKPTITTTEAMFIIQLMKHKWDANNPHPGFPGIASRMGVTPTSARSYARNLENNGYIRRVQRIGETNEFDLTPLFKVLEQRKKTDKT